MINNFKFFMPVKVYFKSGIIKEISTFIDELKITKILIVTDSNIYNLEWFKDIQNDLNNKKINYYTCIITVGEPTESNINKVISSLTDYEFDGIIGIGGGSSMDTAKTLNVAISHNCSDIRKFLRPSKSRIINKIPMILVPTTAGTGAEITRGAVVVDEKIIAKRGFSNDGCYADIALVDPSLGRTLPKEVIASTGLDAFCHAIESFLVNNNHPVSKCLAKHAIELICSNLSRFYKDSNDVEACSNMFLASMLSTIAFSTGTGLTFSHHISDILGARYKIPHGFASFFTLATTLGILEKDLTDENLNYLINTFKTSDLKTFIIKLGDIVNAPNFTKYFNPLSNEEIENLIIDILNNAYRAVGINEKQLRKVLYESFGKLD